MLHKMQTHRGRQSSINNQVLGVIKKAFSDHGINYERLYREVRKSAKAGVDGHQIKFYNISTGNHHGFGYYTTLEAIAMQINDTLIDLGAPLNAYRVEPFGPNIEAHPAAMLSGWKALALDMVLPTKASKDRTKYKRLLKTRAKARRDELKALALAAQKALGGHPTKLLAPMPNPPMKVKTGVKAKAKAPQLDNKLNHQGDISIVDALQAAHRIETAVSEQPIGKTAIVNRDDLRLIVQFIRNAA